MNGFYLTDLLIRSTRVPDVDAHFSPVFKIQGFYPAGWKNNVLWEKKGLNLKICPFISKLDFFFVHDRSSFLLTMLLLLIYAEYQKYSVMILWRVNAYDWTWNIIIALRSEEGYQNDASLSM